MVYIEHEGALYRGPNRAHPTEIWSFKSREWKPYTGSVPKGAEWGHVLSEADFHKALAELSAG